MASDEETVLAAWYCNECYGKYFIAGFKHGVTSETEMSSSRKMSITISTTSGTEIQDFVKRDFSKNSYWFFEFFDPHGTAPNGPIDTSYVSYWGDMAGGQSCWGERIPGHYEGSYDTSSSYANSIIYYADLRDDILVYWHEEGSQSGSADAGEESDPMGQGVAYAAWDGQDKPACKGVNTLDAIKMPITLNPTRTKTEIITLGNLTPYTSSDSTTLEFNVAASDRSGYSGGVAYDTYKWGDYARIDESQPYDCKEGSYTEEASPERLEDYYNSWDTFGSYKNIDEYDKSIWDGNFNKIGVDYIPDGTHAYPNFVSIDVLPHGSFVTDAEGNRFYSMVTSDNKAYNKLNSDDPNSISKLTVTDQLVFYPVAPC